MAVHSVSNVVLLRLRCIYCKFSCTFFKKIPSQAVMQFFLLFNKDFQGCFWADHMAQGYDKRFFII